MIKITFELRSTRPHFPLYTFLKKKKSALIVLSIAKTKKIYILQAIGVMNE